MAGAADAAALQAVVVDQAKTSGVGGGGEYGDDDPALFVKSIGLTSEGEPSRPPPRAINLGRDDLSVRGMNRRSFHLTLAPRLRRARQPFRRGGGSRVRVTAPPRAHQNSTASGGHRAPHRAHFAIRHSRG